MTEADSVNWESLRDRGESIMCRITPRPKYKGQMLKECMGSLIGLELPLRVLWKMDADDPYPGEYALGEDSTDRRMWLNGRGIVWIASGDVTPL